MNRLSAAALQISGTDIFGIILIYIENPDAEPLPVTYGLSDDAFIRGKVPMTKSEIRSVVLSKLKLTKNAILFDIGAGTGSIAIEAAQQIPDGRVYAIERNPDGLDLIKENSLRLQADNLNHCQRHRSGKS